jgi:hypothetical protein
MARCHEGFQHWPHAPAQLVVEKVSAAVPAHVWLKGGVELK